jgi:RND family efflux transporter MFP subunit
LVFLPPITVQAAKQHPASNELTETSGSGFYTVLLLVVAMGVGAFYWGLLPKLKKHEMVLADTKDLAVVRVKTAKPVAAPSSAILSLSGELKPAAEASILARVPGYVRNWNVDMGDQVTAGQVLAELDTPELERERARAEAQLALAEAAKNLAATTAHRWDELLEARTASKQEADEKKADLELKTAAVDAARAEVQRLNQIAKFATITAPFSGTITARRLDVGQLVEAGGSKELFRLSETHRLRVFVRVPQAYARSVSVGQEAEIALPELLGQTFKARIVRTAGAIDPASRTLLTELEVDNSKGSLLAGSYAQVLLPSAKKEAPLTISANALIFRSEGAQVAVADSDGVVHLVKVALGRDFGSSVELVEGVTAESRVILNPPDSLSEGIRVEVVE